MKLTIDDFYDLIRGCEIEKDGKKISLDTSIDVEFAIRLLKGHSKRDKHSRLKIESIYKHIDKLNQ